MKKPVFMLGEATNIPEFKRFLQVLAGELKNPYAQSKPHLVMDNHRAHRSEKVADLLGMYFVAEFQPAYSSPFNC